MIEPELYLKSGGSRLEYIRNILSQFEHNYCWSDDEQVLDIGCGNGQVTRDILLPFLPPTARITGMDKSQEMIKYAKLNYSGSRIGYRVQDFDLELPAQQTYHKIFSFFVFHFISDMEVACKNVYDLLKVNGHATLHMVTKVCFLSVIKNLLQQDEWKPYEKNYNAPVMLHEADNPAEYFGSILSKTGFRIIESVTNKFSGRFQSMDQFIDFFKSLTPYLSSISDDKKDKFLDQVIHELQNHEDIEILPSGEVIFTWHNLAILAKK